MSAFKVDRKSLAADAVAGLTFAIVNIPQAVAKVILADVNPVLGLYMLMIAIPVGVLATSSVFMNMSTTSALSVAAGGALINFSAADCQWLNRVLQVKEQETNDESLSPAGDWQSN